MDVNNKPRVFLMGEEISWDEVPVANVPVENEHYFAPVTISTRAVNEASKMIPKEHWEKEGVHAFLERRANFIFQKMPTSMTEARFRSLIYVFEYSSNGPVLKALRFVEE